MNKVTKEIREIKPAVPAVTEEVFVLRLERPEAEFLLRLVGSVAVCNGPHSMMGRGGTWDALFTAVGPPQTKYGKAVFDVQVLP